MNEINVFILPCGKGARKHYERTIKNGISKIEIKHNLTLPKEFGEDILYVWALTKIRQKIFNTMNNGDIIFLIGDGKLIKFELDMKFIDKKLGDYLWKPECNKHWDHIIILKNKEMIKGYDMPNFARVCGYNETFKFPGSLKLTNDRIELLKYEGLI